MDFRSDYWSLCVSRLPDVSLVHGLLLIRHLLDSPEVVESDLADFFGDLEDVYTREMFCRFALASGGGVRPTPDLPRCRYCQGQGGGPRRRRGPRAGPSPRPESASPIT